MRGGEVAVAVPPVALATVLLPLAALTTCLLWATLADFEKATWTHCEVAQFAPSISAVVGGPGHRHAGHVVLGTGAHTTTKE